MENTLKDKKYSLKARRRNTHIERGKTHRPIETDKEHTDINKE
jgi:hypothetical protein